MEKLPLSFSLSEEVSKALFFQSPVLAFESAVITHGLPYPQNLELARDVEAIARANGVIPATTALINGVVKVGLIDSELTALAKVENPVKLSSRNFGIGISNKSTGGTTVAATLIAARTVGIRVFATGGIGGVHRGSPFDISADLDELARSPVIVVCAGAKAILDLPATLEVLESRGVPVIGYKTAEFPAFYSRESGLPVDTSAGSVKEVCDIAIAHWEAGLKSAILVCIPPPVDYALDKGLIENLIQKATKQAEVSGIVGSRLTPFLLEALNHLSSGKSLETNLALLRNNATVATEIANYLSIKHREKWI
jgi:pseudouridine-5'-phosphate glycosidase